MAELDLDPSLEPAGADLEVDPTPGLTTWTRRGFIGVGLGYLAATVAGCGDSDSERIADAQTASTGGAPDGPETTGANAARSSSTQEATSTTAGRRGSSTTETGPDLSKQPRFGEFDHSDREKGRFLGELGKRFANAFRFGLVKVGNDVDPSKNNKLKGDNPVWGQPIDDAEEFAEFMEGGHKRQKAVKKYIEDTLDSQAVSEVDKAAIMAGRQWMVFQLGEDGFLEGTTFYNQFDDEVQKSGDFRPVQAGDMYIVPFTTTTNEDQEVIADDYIWEAGIRLNCVNPGIHGFHKDEPEAPTTTSTTLETPDDTVPQTTATTVQTTPTPTRPSSSTSSSSQPTVPPTSRPSSSSSSSSSSSTSSSSTTPTTKPANPTTSPTIPPTTSSNPTHPSSSAPTSSQPDPTRP